MFGIGIALQETCCDREHFTTTARCAMPVRYAPCADMAAEYFAAGGAGLPAHIL